MGIVWILGAGFSRPLGGPLLGKLLSPEAERDVAVRYPRAEKLYGSFPREARLLYHNGRGKTANQLRSLGSGNEADGEMLWDDAEEYLDYLDTAASRGPGSPASDRLLQIIGDKKLNLGLPYGDTTLKSLAASARRLLAAECCAFLRGADSGSER
jgi:hypothetical protein